MLRLNDDVSMALFFDDAFGVIKHGINERVMHHVFAGRLDWKNHENLYFLPHEQGSLLRKREPDIIIALPHAHLPDPKLTSIASLMACCIYVVKDLSDCINAFKLTAESFKTFSVFEYFLIILYYTNHSTQLQAWHIGQFALNYSLKLRIPNVRPHHNQEASCNSVGK